MSTIYRGLFLLSVLLAGCFNPDYMDGGFLCSGDATCPEGFSCVREWSQEVCRPDAEPVGPEPAPCGDPQLVATDLLGKVLPLKTPHFLSLAVTRSGAPVVVYASKDGTIRFASYHKGAWVSDDVPEARGDIVAVGSTADKTVVVHGWLDNTGLQLSSVDLHAPTLNWTPLKSVGDISDIVTSLDMAGTPTDAYLAVTTGKQGGSAVTALEYAASGAFKKICGYNNSKKLERYIGARVGASSAGMAYSAFHEGFSVSARKLVIESRANGDTSCVKQATMNTVGYTGLVEPLIGAAVLGQDGVHVATPTAVAAKQNELKYAIWDGIASKPVDAQKWPENVRTASVDLALSPNEDVAISFRETQEVALWQYETKNDTWKRTRLSTITWGHLTRVVVGPDGTIHVAWDETSDMTKGNLHYACVKPK